MSFHSVRIQLLKTLNNAPFPYPRLGNAFAQIDTSSISVSVAIAAQPRPPSPVNGERAPLRSGILHSLAPVRRNVGPTRGKTERHSPNLSHRPRVCLEKFKKQGFDNQVLGLQNNNFSVQIDCAGRLATQLRIKRIWYLIFGTLDLN